MDRASVTKNKQTNFKCNFILDLISKWGPKKISKQAKEMAVCPPLYWFMRDQSIMLVR